MKIGNIVTYKQGTGRYLRSGGEAYPYAIVATLEPLTLISPEGDMKWSATVEPEHLEIKGDAGPELMQIVNERLARDTGR